MPEIIPILLLFGLCVGTFGTMMGVGGGFLHVPFLMLAFGFPPQDAVADSIAIIFLNTFCGSVNYYYQGRMDFDLAKKLAPAVIPGATIGPLLVEHYSSRFFFILFTGVLLFCSFYLYFGHRHISVLPGSQYNRRRTIRDAFGNTVSYSTNVELGQVGTLLIGFLSNLAGIGGGVIHVPFLILFLRVPTHIAIGTSHLLLCVSSGLGAAMFVMLGRVHANFAFPIGIGAILGSVIGANLAQRTAARRIRQILALVLLGIAGKMALKLF